MGFVLQVCVEEEEVRAVGPYDERGLLAAKEEASAENEKASDAKPSDDELWWKKTMMLRNT